MNLQQKKKDFDSRFDVIIWMIEISCRKETLQMIRGLISDIPQMFAKIQQFFTLSFFLKIAFPIQAYFLEISHTFWSCTFNESF